MLNKRSLLWIFGIIVIVTLMLYHGWEEIKTILLRANASLLLFLCFLQLATLTISVYQWYYLLKKLHPKLSFRRVFTVYLAGNFVESVTPSVKFGGEATRVHLFRRNTSLSYQELAGALLAYKYISLLPFVLLCAAVLLITTLRHGLPAIVYLSFLLLGFLFALICWLLSIKSTETQWLLNLKVLSKQPLIHKSIKRALHFLKDASGHARHMTDVKDQHILLFLSLVVWALYPVKVFLVAAALDLNVDPLTVAISTYTAYLISMLPLLPGGLGSFEGSMAFMFSVGGLDMTAGMAIALLSRSITFWFPLILSAGAVIYLSLAGISFFERREACKSGNPRGP